jgi:predicted transcriptional regulator
MPDIKKGGRVRVGIKLSPEIAEQLRIEAAVSRDEYSEIVEEALKAHIPSRRRKRSALAS